MYSDDYVPSHPSNCCESDFSRKPCYSLDQDENSHYLIIIIMRANTYRSKICDTENTGCKLLEGESPSYLSLCVRMCTVLETQQVLEHWQCK